MAWRDRQQAGMGIRHGWDSRTENRHSPHLISFSLTPLWNISLPIVPFLCGGTVAFLHCPMRFCVPGLCLF